MARNLSSKKYLNLWSSKNSSNRLSLASGNYESYCKKAIDGLCLDADMAETLDEYIVTFCEGMEKLIKMGIPKRSIMKHSLALSKILRLGDDVIEYSQRKSDLFYVGLFIDQKITSHWYELSFYKIIKGMLDLLYKEGRNLPSKLKVKIERLVKENNYPLYALYFLKNRSPAFKKSG